MRAAMTLRSRLIFSVVPRLGETAVPPPVVTAVGADAPAGTAPAVTAARAAEAASSTSCLRIRPPTPVPLSAARSTLLSLASLRTKGVTYAEASAALDGAAGATAVEIGAAAGEANADSATGAGAA